MPALSAYPYSPRPCLQARLESADVPDIFPFVRARFQAVHEARIIRLLPEQFTVRAADGQLLATAGLQSAERGGLFLEHYLNQPVEMAVAQALNRPVARADIVELGNLAAQGGHTHSLILAMMRYLAGTRCRYVVFTLTAPVRATFRRMGLPLTALSEAAAERVPQPENWGAYYQQQPIVMVGDIAAGLAALEANPILARAAAQLSTQEGPR
ncbi:thermostable hemolysin [Chitinimonas taiwanensis]|uniref:thermostable hemolysin n=1 Tax=Chitinimonas taiwanensis TaxID=240412 RepID=UPI0035AF9F50